LTNDPAPRANESRPGGGGAPSYPGASVVIVSYNSASYLPRCLDCLGKSEGVDLEVIVVDNASRDDSAAIAEAHPVVSRVIRSERNLGCAGGNNVGFRAARRPYVVMVNPDCDVEPETLARLIEPMQQDALIAVTGGKLLYPGTNKIQHAGGMVYPNGMTDHYGFGEEDTGQHDGQRDVDYVTGALLAARRELVIELGCLDEEFFPAYFEETDLCDRLIQSGHRVVYTGQSRAGHWESVEVGGRTSPDLVRLLYKGRYRFLVKNRSAWYIMTRSIPFEIKWMQSAHGKGFRKRIVKAWFGGALFALRCLTRLNRRPRGVRSRLARPSN